MNQNIKFTLKAEDIPILIIEDDPEQLDLIANTLAKSHKILKSNNGVDLTKILQSDPTILALIDYNLQDLTADAIISDTVKELGYKPYFIVMTAFGNERVAVDMMKLGAMDYLVKDPNFYDFLPRVLDNAINAIVRDKELEFTRKSYQQLNNRFESLFADTQDAIYFSNINGEIVGFNPAMMKLFKYTEEELKGLNSDSLYYNPIDREKFKNDIMDKGYLRNYEVTLRRSDGKPIDCLLVSNLNRNAQGEIIGYNGIIHNITERKIAEKRLIDSEERYRNLFVRVPVGVYRSTPDGKILDANPALIRILGAKDIHDLLNRNVMEFYVNPFDRISWKSYVDNSEVAYNYEVELQTAKGANIWINDSSRAIKSTDGNILYYEGVVEDITQTKRDKQKMQELIDDLVKSKGTIEFQLGELNKLNKKLQQSERELIQLNASKDKFFSIIAHDLKSPFTGFMGLTSLLNEDIDEMEKFEIAEMAGALNKSANNIFALLQNLLNWSKVQGGLIEIKPENINLSSVFEDNLNIVRGAAEQKNISLICEFEKELIVDFDKNILDTVLRNLLANAVKFTYPGGAVKLCVQELKGQEALISVCDNGVGMDKKHLAKLFSIDESNRTSFGTAQEKGTGLGLILCKELLEKCNSTLWVESEEEKGSKFSFTVKTV
jgi:PAS domain S-box-containing protein